MLADAKTLLMETESMLAKVRDLFVGVAAGRGQLTAGGALQLAQRLEMLRKTARVSLDLIDLPERAEQVHPVPPQVM
jgi:hypothetical protein